MMISQSSQGPTGVDDHVVTYAATVLYPRLLLFILGNINTVVVVIYQVEPAISVTLAHRLPNELPCGEESSPGGE
jgi:hypothetical protein